jgi:hypothetical protein
MNKLPYAHLTDACHGCGREDPCGEHYADCALLEPGDFMVSRASERFLGVYEGPCKACAWFGEPCPAHLAARS